MKKLTMIMFIFLFNMIKSTFFFFIILSITILNIFFMLHAGYEGSNLQKYNEQINKNKHYSLTRV